MASIEGIHLGLIDIDTDHLVANIGEAGPGH
jgi:hypothetical protein